MFYMGELVDICKKGPTFRTFAEMFLEVPTPEYNISGVDKVILIHHLNSIPIPYPTFCTFMKIPVIDDADYLE